MKRVLWLLPILFLVGCSSESGNYRQDLENPKELRVGMAVPYFVFAQPDPLRGIDVEMSRSLAREMGLQARIKDLEFYELRPALERGDIDVAISAIVPTPERKRGVLFSDPYLERTLVLLGRPGERVGVVRDSVAEGRADPSWETTEFSDKDAMLRAYQKGKVDSIFLGSAETLTYQNIPVLESYNLGESLVVMLPEDSSALLERVNRAIETLRSAGKIEQIKNRWLLG